jgi:hypothetical protein
MKGLTIYFPKPFAKLSKSENLLTLNEWPFPNFINAKLNAIEPEKKRKRKAGKTIPKKIAAAKLNMNA